MKKNICVFLTVMLMAVSCTCVYADNTKKSDESKKTEELPKGEDKKDQEEKEPKPNEDGIYRVILMDKDDNPVEEAMVQFCSDTTCMIGETDEKGIAEFKAEEGQVYIIHILEVPDGFEGTDEEYKSLEAYCDIPIVLEKE